MDNANVSFPKNRAQEPDASGSDRRETAASSIRYSGAKEARVSLPLVLAILAALAVAIIAARHFIQA